MRDTRMVERKKTGSAKARKKVSYSVRCRLLLYGADQSVRLGQEIVLFAYTYACFNVLEQAEEERFWSRWDT